VEYGWLRREPTSPGEIKNLLGIVGRSLADSRVAAVSTEVRFIAAFNAALCVATTALRASGHRTVTQACYVRNHRRAMHFPTRVKEASSRLEKTWQSVGSAP
jgi:hypothetical protein